MIHEYMASERVQADIDFLEASVSWNVVRSLYSGKRVDIPSGTKISRQVDDLDVLLPARFPLPLLTRFLSFRTLLHFVVILLALQSSRRLVPYLLARYRLPRYGLDRCYDTARVHQS